MSDALYFNDRYYEPPDGPRWDHDADGIHPDEIPGTWVHVGGCGDFFDEWTATTLENWLTDWGNRHLPESIHGELDWLKLIAEWEGSDQVYIGKAGCYFCDPELAVYFGLRARIG